jgi:hypothetical protein
MSQILEEMRNAVREEQSSVIDEQVKQRLDAEINAQVEANNAHQRRLEELIEARQQLEPTPAPEAEVPAEEASGDQNQG